MFQKNSALAQWYRARMADGRRGTGKAMIVALARKLLARLLEGDRRGFPGHQAPALLGSQDRQRAQQGRPLVQVNMKADLREINGAPTRAAAEAAIDVFVDKDGAKYEKVVARSTKDREALLAFFDFPAEHWDHVRTSNPIESMFATVQNPTIQAKGCLSNKTALSMIFKVAQAADKSWNRLRSHEQCRKSSSV